jgi:prophage DNA circulation protein
MTSQDALQIAANSIIPAWVAIVNRFGVNATSIYNDVQSLDDGNDYGRFFASGNPLIPYQTADTSIAAIQAQAATLREMLAAAITQLNSDVAVGNLGASLVADVQAVLLALSNCSALASDQINILGQAAVFPNPYLLTGNDAFGQQIQAAQAAISSVLRVAALFQLASAVFTYTPTSQGDAGTLRILMAQLFDAEMTTQAGLFNDIYYNDLSAVRLNIVQYLTQTANSLAPVGTFTFGTTLPSLALAQMLYQNAGLEPDLVARNVPIHPGFMPTTIEALLP